MCFSNEEKNNAQIGACKYNFQPFRKLRQTDRPTKINGTFTFNKKKELEGEVKVALLQGYQLHCYIDFQDLEIWKWGF